MAKDTVLTEAQKEILGKVISKAGASTFALCTNEEQEAKLKNWRNVKKQLNGRQPAPEQEKELNDFAKEIKTIYEAAVYCPYCGKKAKVEGEANLVGKDTISFSCDCEGAKNEVKEKLDIEAKQKELDDKFYNIQVAASNAAIRKYREHYKDIIEFRKKAFEKLDNDILNAPEL